jgi:N-acetylglucosaminyl-diphospho-decaprenol L-rhamnosyltransferase
LIINPDTRIIGNALLKMIEFANKQNKLGAVAPRLLNNDGTIQASCFKFPTITNAIKYNFFGSKNSYKKYNPGDKTVAVDVAVMAAFLVPKSTINQVGGLDERFFLYYEDVEYCQRLNRNKLPIYYYPEARVQHAHGASGNFTMHLKSPLLASAKIYYGSFYFAILNIILWVGHKWQVILRGKKFRD